MTIISIEQTQARARFAYEQGRGRDEHDMNPWVAAVEIWQAEWDRLDREHKSVSQLTTPNNSLA